MNTPQLEALAALYEAKAAEAEYAEAFTAWAADRTPGSATDYAMWSASGYADSAQRAWGQCTDQLKAEIVADATRTLVDPLTGDLFECTPYAGTEVCGHCQETADYEIRCEGWTDYECAEHAREWWGV